LERQAESRREHVTKVELSGSNQLIGQKERRTEESIYFIMGRFDVNGQIKDLVTSLDGDTGKRSLGEIENWRD
jgi:hypothetical protein